MQGGDGGALSDIAFDKGYLARKLSLFVVTLVILLCPFITSDVNASFPGSSGMIAVQRAPDFRALSSEIWLYDWQTGASHRLTYRGYDRRPAFSPDGNRIAFVSDIPRGWLNIWSIRSDGSGLRRLTRGRKELSAESPAFSADGRWVAFTAEPWSGVREIQRVPSTGGRAHTLVSAGPRVNATDPNFSPDGKSLAWVQWREESNVPPKVYIGRSNGRRGRPVTIGYDPEFSPDGRGIVFLRQGRCPSGALRTTIAVRSLDSGQQYPLKSTCGAEREMSDPTYSPDGSWIAYTAYQEERAEVAFIPVPGMFPTITPLGRLGMAPSIIAEPSWQPTH